MVQLRRLLCFLLLLCSVLGAPLSPVASVHASQQGAEPDQPPPEDAPKGVTWSSFGHLGINLGIAGVAVLGIIGVAEAAFHLIGVHRKHTTERKQMEISRGKDQARQKDQILREEEALEILVDLAANHVKKVEEEGFERKLRPLVVPKEIHQSLEGIFKKKDAFNDLKAILGPLLDFEE
jgi:hypothetical protein